MSARIKPHHENNSTRPGSLGHQFLGLLKAVFKPGRSRHLDKKRGQAHLYIYAKNTMRKYTEEAFTFARFLKEQHPNCKRPDDINPEMCAAFIKQLVARKLDGGTLGRYQAMIRKVDSALRYQGSRDTDAPPLLPTEAQGGQAGFRSNRSTEAYTPDQLIAIVAEIEQRGSRLYGPTAVQIVRLMAATGLRIQEAVYLRAANIDLNSRRVTLERNRSRAKGGRRRITAPFDEAALGFMATLVAQSQLSQTGHLFRDRNSLPGDVRAEIRRTCRGLQIECLGSHAFRKLNAQNLYAALRSQGASDETALRRTSRHLGHNRIRDTKESYVPPQDRQRKRA